MDDHCTTAWAVKLAGPWGDFEAAGRDRIKLIPATTFTNYLPDQLEAWRNTVEPIKASWAAAVKQAGADPEAASPSSTPASRNTAPVHDQAGGIGIIKTRVLGDPDMARVSTSYSERHNLNVPCTRAA